MGSPLDLSDCFPDRDGFCHPDWPEIHRRVEAAVPEAGWPDAFDRAVRTWLGRLRGQAGGACQLHETDNFLLLSEAPPRIIRHATRFYEGALGRILQALPGVAADDSPVKHVVLMFARVDDYYRYLSPIYPDGENPMSGGIFLSGGTWPHFAFPDFDSTWYRGVLVHELTHGCLAHLPLPPWLNEALAMRMENAISESSPLRLDQDIYARHAAHWNSTTIQQFWSGESWQIAGDSNELSYSLAQILWRKIEVDLRPGKPAVLRFAAAAAHRDAGEGAFREAFGASLGDLAGEFLGEGEWTPDPAAWQAKAPAAGAGLLAADPEPPPIWISPGTDAIERSWRLAGEAESPPTWTGSSGDGR